MALLFFRGELSNFAPTAGTAQALPDDRKPSLLRKTFFFKTAFKR
jgi:hypothetical protein